MDRKTIFKQWARVIFGLLLTAFGAHLSIFANIEVALGTGWAIGGPVGVGTLIGIFGSGLVMQIVFTLVKFEPRDVEHKDVIETVRALIKPEYQK